MVIKMADDEVLYGLGVDISSTFDFIDGDLVLAEYKDNLVQATVNRLNTSLNSLDLLYEDYGSVMTNFFGWRGNDSTIAMMYVELKNTLSEEDRIDSYEADIYYEGEGVMHIDLMLYPSDGNGVDVNLIMNENGEFEINENEEEA